MFFQRIIIAHVTFLKIGEINTVNEKFESDVLIRATWREPIYDHKLPEVRINGICRL